MKLESGQAIVNGLIQTIIHNDKKGYYVYTYRCLKCDNEVSYKHKRRSNCKCGGEMHLVNVIDKEKVQDIVSRETQYLCPKCGRVSRDPADCCLAYEKEIKQIVKEYNAPTRCIEGL